jgi:lysophospholipase L1-like esterase
MPFRSMVLGHSIVRRLADFVHLNPVNLDPSTDVYWSGVGGHTLDTLIRLDLSKVSDYQPDIVVLIIGDNDVKAGSSAEEIAYKIISLVSVLHARYQVTSVIVCGLLPRFPRYHRWWDYNVCASTVNDILSHELQRFTYSKFWSHNVEFPFPRSNQPRQLSRCPSSDSCLMASI